MLIPTLVALAIGICVGLQPVTNASAASQVGVGPIMVASSALVLIASVVFAVVSPGKANWPALLSLRPDLLLGGAVYGCIIVFGGLYAFPRLGASLTLALIVAAQFCAGVMIDHDGLYDMPTRPMSGVKFAGLALILAGAWLLRPTNNAPEPTHNVESIAGDSITGATPSS